MEHQGGRRGHGTDTDTATDPVTGTGTATGTGSVTATGPKRRGAPTTLGTTGSGADKKGTLPQGFRRTRDGATAEIRGVVAAPGVER